MTLSIKCKALDILFEERKKLFSKYECGIIDLSLLDILDEESYSKRYPEAIRNLDVIDVQLKFITKVLSLVRNINEVTND